MPEKGFKEINKERNDLKNKLNKILNKKKRVQKNPLLKIHPIIHKKFRKENESYRSTNSKCDYTLIMTKKAQRNETLKKQKEDFDLNGCTFHPKIDKKSKSLIKEHIEVYKRELPKKKEKKIIEEKKKVRTGKKYNPKFYEEKVEWKNSKYEIHQKKRVDNTLNELKELKDPTTNKKKNEKLVKKAKKFLKRVENDMKDTLEKKTKLEKNMYNSSFKPIINHKHPEGPRVWDHKSQLYISLKRNK